MRPRLPVGNRSRDPQLDMQQDAEDHLVGEGLSRREVVSNRSPPRCRPLQRRIQTLRTTAGQDFLSDDLASFLSPDLAVIMLATTKMTIPLHSFRFPVREKNESNQT